MTPILAVSEIAEGVASQATLHNTALRQLEARSVRVLSRTTTAPPGSPVEGDSYIIPAGATGVWTGLTNQIASWIGGAWSYYTPKEGVTVWVNDLDLHYTYYGSAWGTSVGGGTQPYDMGGGCVGAPTASLVLMRYPFPRTIVFPVGLAPSQGVASVAATALTDFDIRKNNVSCGTMRFAAAATVATFIMAAQTTFVAADVLTLVSPGAPDATLANIGFCLTGTR